MEFTLFTATYNRRDKLPRLYETIKNQTFKDFVWLIIDDGSKDDTEGLIKEWENENKVQIWYIYKENGGKQSAMQMAYKIINTKYLISIDSDDTLLSDTIQNFHDAWKEIENEKLESEIGQVNMFTTYLNNELVGYGNFQLPENVTHIDKTWHELVLKMKCHREFIRSSNMFKLNQCVNIEKYIWHQLDIRFISESVFWASIGRKYKSRLLNKVGRIYYTDAENSILRKTKTKSSYIEGMVSYLYFIDENFNYFLWNIPYFLSMHIKMVFSGLILSETLSKQLLHIKNTKYKIFYLISYLPIVLIFILLSIAGKQYYLGKISRS
jgi:glycosyltransferase involved in cell wall biosynthesis